METMKRMNRINRTGIKRILLAISFMLALSLLSGCTGGVELNELAIVMGIGIDLSPEGYLVTAQIVRPSLLKSGVSGTKTDNNAAYFNIHQSAKTIYTAQQDVSSRFSRRLFVQQCEALVVGDELARNDITPILEFFLRNEESSMIMPILIAESSATEILEQGTYLEIIPMVQIARMTEMQRYTSKPSPTSVFEFAAAMLSKAKQPTAPIVELFTDNAGEVKARITDVAVFKGSRMVGRLAGDETFGFLLLTDQLKSGALCVDGLGGTTDLEITSARSSIKEYWDGRGFGAAIRINVDCWVVASTSAVYVDKAENLAAIGDIARVELADMAQKAILKARELNSDIFGFGERAYQHHYSQFNSLSGGWDAEFQRMPISIEIEVVVTGSGASQQTLKPSVERYEE